MNTKMWLCTIWYGSSSSSQIHSNLLQLRTKRAWKKMASLFPFKPFPTYNCQRILLYYASEKLSFKRYIYSQIKTYNFIKCVKKNIFFLICSQIKKKTYIGSFKLWNKLINISQFCSKSMCLFCLSFCLYNRFSRVICQ